MLVYQFKRLFRQRRFLILTLIVTVIFLMYQLLSVGQLGKELSNRKLRPKLQTNFRNYEKADGFMQPKYSEQKDVNQVESYSHSRLNIIYNEHEGLRYVFGVLPENQKYYFPTTSRTFKCLHSGEEISSTSVNDDFCDCKDFSDEPSTSACNYGKFFCNYQPHKHKEELFVISFKVNDGICDCCDGSDEWQSILLPQHTQVKANKNVIQQTPCPASCVL